ncbi:MAG: hypothetical protein J3R72DRAFT_475862 [Linnemannia gamsii]|nr:MAG: hypothetical protein J3R72DRAFT_475862 [Linnemannia gamsii]
MSDNLVRETMALLVSSTSREGVQAIRLPTLGKTIDIATQMDSTTGQEVVLWSDIALVFRNALYLQYGTKVIPFLKGADFKTLDPLRIAAVPGATLEVVVDEDDDDGSTSFGFSSSRIAVKKTKSKKLSAQKSRYHPSPIPQPTRHEPSSSWAPSIQSARSGAPQTAQTSFQEQSTGEPKSGSFFNSFFSNMRPEVPRERHQRDPFVTSNTAQRTPTNESVATAIDTPDKDLQPSSIDLSALRSPQYGLVEEALANYSHIEVPEGTFQLLLGTSKDGARNPQCDSSSDNTLTHTNDPQSLDSSTLTAPTPTATDAPQPQAQEDIVFVDCQHDPASQKEVVLWDDIILAFNDVLHVRHKAKVVPFLKGADFRVLEPRRIAAVPDAVLDVIIEGKSSQTESIPYKPQEALQDYPQKDITTATTGTTTITHSPQGGSIQEVTITIAEAVPAPAPVVASGVSRAPQAIPDSTDSSNNNNSKEHTQSDVKDTTNRGPQLYVEDLDQTHTNADLGDVAAQVKLGDMYLEGKVAPQNYQSAMKWYLKAADQGSPDAQRKIGTIHCKGLGVSQDYTEGMQWYIRAAGQGGADAQREIGDMYANGLGISQDHKKSMEWYLKAAEQGDPDAQREIGNNYFKGLGVSQDHKKSMDWYLKAAKQGNAPAQCNIAVIYSTGDGVSRDYKNAADWYRKSALQGYALAQRSMGNLYKNGFGVRTDYAKAMEWYQKASAQGLPQAQADVASLHYHGYGVPKDYSTAMRCYLGAAEQSNKAAQFQLGHMFEHGEGTSQDYTKAFEWYIKAAEQGDGGASKCIGQMYYKGLGVLKDLNMAVDWYRKAVEQGNASAKASVDAALKDLHRQKN